MILTRQQPRLVLLSKNLLHACRRCSNLMHTSHENNSNGSTVEKRFVPMTRKTLMRKITENTHLVAEQDQENFMNFVNGLETSISHDFNQSLRELKTLYDPLNPDKETLTVRHVGKKEKQEQEFWLLQKLSSLLEQAHFHEIPRKEVAQALEEHPCHEGVMVKVDMKKYDVIRFWALGQEDIPLQHNNLSERIRNFVNVYMKKWPANIATYKRVVVAMRGKKQNKLFLKAFKDIPVNGLEYILPEGKISISKFDKGIIATTVTIGGMSVALRFLSSFADLNLSWTSIVGGMTALMALSSWNAFKNKRNKYLVELSKTFYYKAIANNRAFLTLAVDRAEDEVFKSALLAYTFIMMENKIREAAHSSTTSAPNNIHMNQLVTVDELNQSVESWMQHRYELDVKFDGKNAFQQLEKMNLLKSQKLGKDVHLKVVDLSEAMQLLPRATSLDLEGRQEELDVEEILPVTDNEIAGVASRLKQREAESASPGWQ